MIFDQIIEADEILIEDYNLIFRNCRLLESFDIFEKGDFIECVVVDFETDSVFIYEGDTAIQTLNLEYRLT